jgi:hypothetical protein
VDSFTRGLGVWSEIIDFLSFIRSYGYVAIDSATVETKRE